MPPSNGNLFGQLSMCFKENVFHYINERDGVSNHHRLDCLLNRLFRRRSKKTSKLCVTGEFPAQKASNTDIFSIWWRHHVKMVAARSMHDFQIAIC